MDVPLKKNQAWEVYKEDSHNGGTVGKDFGALQFTSGKNCVAEIRGRCENSHVSEERMAELFRDDKGSFKHLTDVQSVGTQGILQHMDLMRKFAVRHFSNPEHLPYLMAMLETSLEPFGGQKVGKFPKTIISEEHRAVIRETPAVFAPFLADELRHIYNESLQLMAETLDKNGIDFRKLRCTVKGNPPTALARPKQLEAALTKSTNETAHYHFVASSRAKGEDGGLRYFEIKGFVSTRDVRNMVDALHNGGRVSHQAVPGRALAHIRHSFASQFGGYRNTVPREIARVFSPLHDVIRPFVSAKYEQDLYQTSPGGKMPTLAAALKLSRSSRGTGASPAHVVGGAGVSSRPRTTTNPMAVPAQGARRTSSVPVNFVDSDRTEAAFHRANQAADLAQPGDSDSDYDPDYIRGGDDFYEEAPERKKGEESVSPKKAPPDGDERKEPEPSSQINVDELDDELNGIGNNSPCAPIESLGARTCHKAEKHAQAIKPGSLSGDAGGLF